MVIAKSILTKNRKLRSMGLKIIFLFIFVIIPISAQQSDTTEISTYFKYFIQNHIKFEYQNWEKDKLTFPPGIYYRLIGKIESYQGKKHYTHWTIINHPEIFIGFLFGKGVPVREVWYKDSESDCHGFQVLVDASLLIRTEKEMPESIMNSYGFEKTEPSPGQCPYNIRHYLFE